MFIAFIALCILLLLLLLLLLLYMAISWCLLLTDKLSCVRTWDGGRGRMLLGAILTCLTAGETARRHAWAVPLACPPHCQRYSHAPALPYSQPRTLGHQRIYPTLSQRADLNTSMVFRLWPLYNTVMCSLRETVLWAIVNLSTFFF